MPVNKLSIPLHWLIACLLIMALVQPSAAQLVPITDSIPMRDGKKLAVDFYLPNGGTQALPTILIQTPYDRTLYTSLGLPLDIGFNINNSNYNIVIVDWRCFHGSAAACTSQVNRGQDGYDAVEWIASQSWSNGRIGTWGPSALGVCQYQTARESPPHLICSVPIVAGSQFSYQQYFPGGVLRTEYVQMLDILGYGLSPLLLANPFYNLVWQISESSSYYPQSIGVPMFLVGGWYDHNTNEVLSLFRGLQSLSPLPVRSQHRLLMGPWSHNTSSSSPVAVGELSYPAAQNFSDSLSLLFFDYHLRQIANGWNNSPAVQYFQMGEDNWKSASTWDTAASTYIPFYFHEDSTLQILPPVSSTANLSYIYDPRDPSPTIGGPTLRLDLDQGPYNQWPIVESRNDLLRFTTAPLASPVSIKGQVRVLLQISSDRKDTDFSIRLTDVYPDGRSMLVADGIRRMRFRNGYTVNDTASMIPGSVYNCLVELPATAITFNSGHSIRIDVTSSNYPRFDSNLNNGLQQYATGDTMIAVNTVFTNNIFSSMVYLPVDAASGIESTGSPWGYFNLHPVPAGADKTITVAGPGNFTVSVFSVDGKQVLPLIHGNKKCTISLASLLPGLYIARSSDSKKIQSFKIIVPE